MSEAEALMREIVERGMTLEQGPFVDPPFLCPQKFRMPDGSVVISCIPPPLGKRIEGKKA